jgi:predicted PurR-regulated permease PerM
LGGLQVFGVLGIVLGPVVLAITMALVDVFRTVDRSAKHETAKS